MSSQSWADLEVAGLRGGAGLILYLKDLDYVT